MVLVDTSVWIDHFRKSNAHLQDVLEQGEVATHPFVIGELACGGLAKRHEILALMQALPSYSPISQDEFVHFVESYKLANKGVGFVDIHLLASALLNSDFVWTLDKSLDALARKLRIRHRHS